ncbi:MAG: hypothetical protein IPL10_06900 [Bacteroidetes bacterium]|nr:hypothetical protein [Bacteroidota bacterium]
MIFKIVYTISFLFLSSLSLFSQNEIIHFKIFDDKTKTPIQFGFILIKGENISSQSDEFGNVSIKAKALDTLVIYQLGYDLKKTTAFDIEKNNHIVLLKSKNLTLDEVIINSSKIDTIQATNNTIFLDFDFYDDFILALVDKGGRYNYLQLLDLDGNKISQKKLSVKSETIFKDCFENIHLLTTDSVFQIYYDYKNIILLNPFPISNYYGLLKPCECYHGNKYIFKTKQYRNLKNSYTMYDENKKGTKQIVAIVADSLAIKGFNMDYDINYFLEKRRRGLGYETSMDEIKKHIDELREDLPLSSDYLNLLSPIESEMKKIDTNFVLFAYTNKLVYEFSFDGKLNSKNTLIGFDDIKPKLYIDYDAKSFIFSEMNKNGIVTLFKYDISKNVFTHKFELENYYFIKKFKVKGDHIYFLNKDKTSDLVKTKILKENISWKRLNN